MIKRYFSLLMFTAVLAACGGGEEKNPEKKLLKLKQDRAKLDKEIAELEKKTKDTANVKQKTVTVATVQDTLFEHYIDVQGSIDARENVDVSAKSPGVITNIYVREGQQVSKGQTLAQIDDQVMRSNIAEVKTQMDLANIAFEKQQRLWNQKIGTEMQYLTAKNQKESLERRLATLNDQLALNRIVSPISGTVDAVIAKLGDQAAPGAPSFRVVNTSNLKVVANVAESYAGKVKTGDPVVIVLPDIKKEIRTKIAFASKVIDPLSRTIKVEIPLSPDANLRPNMIAQLKIVDYVASNAVVVPVGVLQYSMGKPYVITAGNSNGKMIAQRKNVELGRTYNDKAEIKSGLQAGEKIVTTGFQGLNDNDLIKL